MSKGNRKSIWASFFFSKKSFYHRRKPMCKGSDKFLSVSLTHELTFRIHWNNIEGAKSPAWCELPHQCIYKQCIIGKFASRRSDHPGRHSGSPRWFIGRIWRPYFCSTEVGNEIQAEIVLTLVLRPKIKICSPDHDISVMLLKRKFLNSNNWRWLWQCCR